MSRKKTIEEFRTKYNGKFGVFYDFSKSVYDGAHNRMVVGCPIHGEFKITPHDLLKGQGCKQCGIERRAEKRKLKLCDFISRSTIIHNGKYIYDLVELEDYKKAVKIICPIHGVFEETPRDHLQGCGCKKCALGYVSELFSDTKEDFIRKSIIVHSNKYDYSLFEYRGSKEEGDIICPIHGIFPQKPYHHLQGSGCPKCGSVASKYEDEIIDVLNKSYDESKNMEYKEKYIERCKKTHGDRYIYTNVEFTKMKDKIKIICPTHGEFIQRADAHLSGQGCPKCADEKVGKQNASTYERFVTEGKRIHGDIYDYNKGVYVNNRTPFRIICPEHGEFWQIPSNHIHKTHPRGCPKCNGGVKLELFEFIQKSNTIHNFKYDYSKVKYVNAHTKVCIICPEHGDFWQESRAHLSGQGCPKCYRSSSHFEDEIMNSLNHIEVEHRNRKVLNGKEIDIYLPQYNLGIEFNGLYWHSEENGKDKDYHLNKLNECNKQGVELIQIFEDEWIGKRNICEAMLKNEIGINANEIIYSSVCLVLETDDNETVNDFLVKNSIFGGDEQYDISIAAYFNDDIVGLMMFKKNTNNEYVLNRITTNITYNCVGVEEKMFDYFKEKYNPNKITYFADRRWVTHVNNNIFTKLGFKIEKIIEPSFTYYKKNTRLGRIKKDEITDESDCTRIWDCGKVKYVYSK